MTYGQLKFRLTKAFPGVDADLIEGWITDCYQAILGRIPWTRLDLEAVLQTTAPYSTGTVSVTNGSSSVALTGGSFTAAMSGTTFRISSDQEEYQFTYSGSTSGTLDRPYSGTTNAAAGYKIYQAVYPLPANCRFLDEGAFDSFETGPMRRLRFEQGQRSSSLFFGPPQLWWPYMDDGSTPPQMQVKVFPIPDKAYGIPYTYSAEVANPTSTTTTMLPWTQPTALIEGSTARITRHLKDYGASDRAAAEYERAISIMMSQDSLRKGPTTMQMSGHYTAHRRDRWR
jgi:hypothetical protein